MKYATLKILAIFTAILIVSPARAGHGDGSDSYVDKAKVVSAIPIYSTVQVSTPRRECREVPVTSYDRHSGKHYKSATPIIVGSVIGAAVGNQFGRGTGKTVGTIAGGVLGGSVARDIQHRYGHRGYGVGQQKTYTTTRCDTVEEYHDE